MNTGKLVFAQVTQHLPLTTFRRCVARYRGEHKVKTFSCLEQYLCMAFAQLTYRESLRDIEACLRAQESKLYHMGIVSRVSRSTLADANEVRDWRIYADFAQSLIGIARRLYAGDAFGVDLKETVYALDASTIDLSLSVFPWAPFRSTKAAVKLHTLLDLRGNIPTFLHISDGKLHDVNILDMLLPEAGAFYVMDRAYIDFERLFRLHAAGSFFVTRAKRNLNAARRYSHPVDRTTGLICDQTIVLAGFYARADFATPLRRIKFNDPTTGKRLVFLTNNFGLPALTITELYRCRWQVELFFKWIKQHLRIKRFFGTSENAVKTQIWIAVSVYVLVAIVKKRLHLPISLYEMLQILSLTMFERMPLDQLLSDTVAEAIPATSQNQLKGTSNNSPILTPQQLNTRHPMLQSGFFDLQDRFHKLDQMGDPLKALNAVVDWSVFEPILVPGLAKEKKGNAGRPLTFAPLLMFKVLILQSLYNLADAQTEFQIRDRFTFLRFLGLTPEGRIPDEKTIWLFRETLKDLRLHEELFATFAGFLEARGFKAERSTVIDARIVEVPRQRNTRSENATIKEGFLPADWEHQPAKKAQKDIEARWTQKHGKNYYGYKNHIGIDVKHKFIRGYDVTAAHVHDSQCFESLLDGRNSKRTVYADSAYRSDDHGRRLRRRRFTNRVHHRAWKDRPLNKREQRENHARSRIRARVEHVFGHQVKAMRQTIVRGIGIARIRTRIALANLAYNMSRLVQLRPPCA